MQEAPFLPPVVLRTTVVGREPSVEVAPDGTIYVCSLRGLGHGSDVWVSTDGGKTFREAGTRYHPEAPPHRSTSGDLGGGDCDLAVDAGGRAYLVDAWGGSGSVSWTDDRGETWDGVPVSQTTGTQDRPWILGGDPKEVFVTGIDIQFTLPEALGLMAGLDGPAALGGAWVARSTDGGKTFPQQTLAADNEDRYPHGGNLALAREVLYLVYSKKLSEDRFAMMVAVSHDRGATWTARVAAQQPLDPRACSYVPLALFPVVAADSAGSVYLAWVARNPETRRYDAFFVSSPDEGATWNPPVLLTPREGTRAFPWINADAPGRVGIVWYETETTLFAEADGPTAGTSLGCNEEDPEPAEWYVRYVVGTQAASPHPSFHEQRVQPTPIHTGAGWLDRPYAELTQIAFDPEGRAVVSYVADVDSGLPATVVAIQADGRAGALS